MNDFILNYILCRLTMDSKSYKLFLLEIQVKENLLEIYENLCMKIMTILFTKDFNILLSFLTHFICPFYLKMWSHWIATILCKSHKASPKISRRDFPVSLNSLEDKACNILCGPLCVLGHITQDISRFWYMFLKEKIGFFSLLLHMKKWNIFSERKDIQYYHHHNIIYYIIL